MNRLFFRLYIWVGYLTPQNAHSQRADVLCWQFCKSQHLLYIKNGKRRLTQIRQTFLFDILTGLKGGRTLDELVYDGTTKIHGIICVTWTMSVNLQLNKNKCIEQELFGSKVMFCCCNDRDLCNAGHRPSITAHLPIISIVCSMILFFFKLWLGARPTKDIISYGEE